MISFNQKKKAFYSVSNFEFLRLISFFKLCQTAVEQIQVRKIVVKNPSAWAALVTALKDVIPAVFELLNDSLRFIVGNKVHYLSSRRRLEYQKKFERTKYETSTLALIYQTENEEVFWNEVTYNFEKYRDHKSFLGPRAIALSRFGILFERNKDEFREIIQCFDRDETFALTGVSLDTIIENIAYGECDDARRVLIEEVFFGPFREKICRKIVDSQYFLETFETLIYAFQEVYQQEFCKNSLEKMGGTAAYRIFWKQEVNQINNTVNDAEFAIPFVDSWGKLEVKDDNLSKFVVDALKSVSDFLMSNSVICEVEIADIDYLGFIQTAYSEIGRESGLKGIRYPKEHIEFLAKRLIDGSEAEHRRQ